MNIYEKLMAIQTRLKAPKSQYNSFGKYHYRSLEDISEAVKPLLAEVKAILTISDEPVIVGNRTYILAKAAFINAEKPEEVIVNTAFAREPETKKGMDDSQVTGATSSYARKYCLNGLFCIDDNKDADSMQPPYDKITDAQAKELADLIEKTQTDINAFLKHAQSESIGDIPPANFLKLKSMLLAKLKKAAT